MPALPITGSADITVLDFAVLYDISGASPLVTLTNRSVGNPSGATNLNLCTWWYVLTTPSGMPIHIGSVTAPDVTAADWTTLTTPTNSWPTPFGTPPCGQIEFSCAVPYVCTLYVKDAAGTIYSLTKNTTICRPNGSTSNTCGSFGAADTIVAVQCQNAKIYAQDNTNYTYQGILGTQQSSLWTLQYPADASGDIPPNANAVNAPYAYFPIGYSGDGYRLYLQTYATYALADECSVKIQYKLISDSGIGTGRGFGVFCNIDLCKLDCGMQKFYDQVEQSCGEVENPELKQKAIQVNLLYNRLLTGIIQPLCNIDVPGIIKQIEDLAGFKCDCCCGGGINVGNPVPTPNGNGGCCPVTTKVVIVGTTNAPAECPNSYFPRQVYDPTSTTIIGTANSADDMVSILNANAAWAVYGTAFNQGNCQVGWYPSNQGTIIPTVKVAGETVVTNCQGNTQNYTVTTTDICNNVIPINASEFPLNIFIDYGAGAGIESVGTFATQADMIAGLNAKSDKPATITYSAGSSVSSVNVFNSSCTAYSGVISITATADSGSYLLYGANHTSLLGLTPTVNGEYGIALRTSTLLGKLPGADPTKHMFHNIRINNYLITSESDTGKIYFWNITSPLMPTLARTIQLNAVVGSSFTGVPNSSPLFPFAALTGSWFSLYFPTDNLGNMTENTLVVIEGITGTAWKLNFSDPGSGVTASFQDDRLLGKCPRCVVTVTGKTMLYLTEDGNLESSASLSSGVADGSIVKMSLDNFTSGGIATQAIYSAPMYSKVLAASFDGSNTIYFTTKDGNIIRYNPTSQTVVNTTAAIPSAVFLNWVNTSYFNGRLFIVSTFNYTTPSLFSVDVLSLVTPPVAVVSFPEFSTDYFMTALPLGSCLLAVTAYHFPADGDHEGGKVFLFKTDGTFLGYLLGSATSAVQGKSLYNLVYAPNINSYTPNSFS